MDCGKWEYSYSPAILSDLQRIGYEYLKAIERESVAYHMCSEYTCPLQEVSVYIVLPHSDYRAEDRLPTTSEIAKVCF